MGVQDREYVREREIPSGGFRAWSAVGQLVAINCGLFVLNALTSRGFESPLFDAMAIGPTIVDEPWNWWRLLSAGFAHSPSDINHLLFNMSGLWFLGPYVERRLGRRRFHVFYLSAIVLSSAVYCLWRYFLTPEPSWRSALGASGAVTAVVILFALQNPHDTLLLFFVLPIKAWALAILFVVMDLTGAVGGRDNVAHDVHLAGAAFAGIYFLPSGGLPTIRRRPRLRVSPETMPEEHSERDEEEEALAAEADRVLEKVHRLGEESLTRRERQVLEAYSRQVRERRR